MRAPRRGLRGSESESIPQIAGCFPRPQFFSRFSCHRTEPLLAVAGQQTRRRRPHAMFFCLFITQHCVLCRLIALIARGQPRSRVLCGCEYPFGACVKRGSLCHSFGSVRLGVLCELVCLCTLALSAPQRCENPLELPRWSPTIYQELCGALRRRK